MISKSLLKKTGLYFIGNLSTKILSVLLIPIYAFYVSTNDLGYFDFSQTLMGILSPIILLAIWEGILKFILSEDNMERKQKIITTSSVFSLIMSILFILIVILSSLVYENSIRYLGLIVTMILLNSFVLVWQYYARAFGKNILYVKAGILSALINFSFVLLLVVVINLGLLGLLISYILGQLSIIVYLEKDLRVLKNLCLKDFELNLLKKILSFSSPLVLNLISAWLISGFGRFIITIKLGPEANGLFSFASRFSLMITMIGTVVTMAIIEEAIISEKKNKLNSNFNKTIESLFKVFQILSIVAVPAIVIIYTLLSDTNYYSSLIFTPWLLIYAVANTMASNMGSVFQAINKTSYQFLTTFLGAIVTISLSLYFIEEIGIVAVIIGQILGAITMLVARYLLINKFLNFKINWIPILFRTLLFILVTVICLNLPYYYSILIEILLIIFLVFSNWGVVKKGSNKIKEMMVKR